MQTDNNMIRHRLIQSIIWLTTYLVLYPILHIAFSVKIKSVNNFKNVNTPLLIIANHKSMIDPWIIPIMMPMKVFTKVSPIRFTGATYFNSPARQLLYTLGIIKFIYFLYDVIPLKKEGTLYEKLQPFKEAIGEGSAVMFFPEGTMVKEDKVKKFKRGSAVLAKMTNANIWPISIKYSGNGWRKKCDISYGKTFKIPKNLFQKNDNPHFTRATAYLEQKIQDLYKAQ